MTFPIEINSMIVITTSLIAIALCPVMIVMCILITYVTPIQVIDRYVKPPHFSEFEMAVYRYYPGTVLRTNLFSVMIAFPFFRRFRKVGDIHKNVPLWFNLLCRIYVYLIICPCLAGFLIMVTVTILTHHGILT